MTPAFRAIGLSKKYAIAHEQGDSYATLRESLSRKAKDLALAMVRPSRIGSQGAKASKEEEFWALWDVSFEITKGARLGIIGRNGAGKSTLLKILSRITSPTRGKVEIRGRIASLLEVGTGFHPELSGRENIFLNAAILGMRREEIARKFDEIVSFAEVERFLDTPVKRYSSGMHVRLAFAVAAHLDPEILIVDEVLAVGDRQFQEKCLGRMEAMSLNDGRTVIFVSHNLDAIQRLCKDAMYLREGRLAYLGSVQGAIKEYVASALLTDDNLTLSDSKERWGSGGLRICELKIQTAKGEHTNVLKTGEDYRFVLTFKGNGIEENIRDGIVSLAMANSKGTRVLLVSSEFTSEGIFLDCTGGVVECVIKDLNLAQRDYTLTLFLGSATAGGIDCLNDCVRVSVIGGDFFGTGHPGFPEQCSTLTRSTWTVRK
jgi:lipopolysaccharide transport system ATP-binding protein